MQIWAGNVEVAHHPSGASETNQWVAPQTVKLGHGAITAERGETKCVTAEGGGKIALGWREAQNLGDGGETLVFGGGGSEDA